MVAGGFVTRRPRRTFCICDDDVVLKAQRRATIGSEDYCGAMLRLMGRKIVGVVRQTASLRPLCDTQA